VPLSDRSNRLRSGITKHRKLLRKLLTTSIRLSKLEQVLSRHFRHANVGRLMSLRQSHSRLGNPLLVSKITSEWLTPYWDEGFDGLKGMKTNAFAKAIAGDTDAVVVDVWMMRAAQMSTDSPTQGQYRAISQAVVRVAGELGLTPRTAQALIWIVIKGRQSKRHREIGAPQKCCSFTKHYCFSPDLWGLMSVVSVII